MVYDIIHRNIRQTAQWFWHVVTYTMAFRIGEIYDEPPLVKLVILMYDTKVAKEVNVVVH